MSNTVLAMGYDANLRLAAASPRVVLGDPALNGEAVIRAIRRAEEAGADYLALPELCLAGATLGTLLGHKTVLDACRSALTRVCEATRGCTVAASVGLPYLVNGVPRSCLALLRGGRILALIPAGGGVNPYGFAPAMERCAPARRTLTPVSRLAAGFAAQIFNGQPEPREGYAMLISSSFNATAKSYHEIQAALGAYSARTGMALAYASPHKSESTTAYVFDGLCAIAAGGEVLCRSKPLEEEPFVFADVSADKLPAFEPFLENDEGEYLFADPKAQREQLGRILDLQAAALCRRASHIGSGGFVVGVSGGLDSALALLAACAAAEELGMGTSAVLGVSMPGFGTSARTKNNSEALVRSLGCQYREISVVVACRQHFADVGHEESNRNAVYENAQARERTKILLSIANGENLLDVGTGDLSEAALGWTTFGGDHLAQYGVNASIPKTVIRKVVAEACSRFPGAADVLEDILATPVSPELLPTVNGEIAQKTEELVGNYELHDLFLYYFMQGKGPRELYELALSKTAFPAQEIYRVLGVFLKRFFAQQFKRNCAPEAPLICLSIAPAAFTLPSDMGAGAFWREYEELGRQESALSPLDRREI